jgi:hypothetical protein
MNPKNKSIKALLLLALLITLLNSFKPLVVDDTLYHYYAANLANEPLKPYAFELYWLDLPTPAIAVLAPPLFPYYWAIGIKLFGEHPFLWKLWLLPLALLLVFALHALFRRFAPGQEMWLTWLTIISPVFLPSFNLMLEIPVAALTFYALNLFFRATDLNSLKLALASGFFAGLAMQTKYTAFILVPLMLLHGIIFRKLRFSMTAALLSLLIFCSIEGFIILSAGHSHLLYQTGVYSSVNFWKKYKYLAWPLLTMMGACAPAVALVAMVVLGASRRVIGFVMVLIVTGYLMISFVPEQYSTWSIRYRPSGELITLAHVIFSVFGLLVWIGLLAVIRRLCNLDAGWSGLRRWREYDVEWFLVLWLLGEVASYFLLSPIPAVRRLPDLLIVGTLLVGRLISKLGISTEQKRLLRFVAVSGMALGLIFYVVDLNDAFVEKIAAERADRRTRELAPNVHRWYFARWGFQFYAERAGMMSVVPDRSVFQNGDWLVLTDGLTLPPPVADNLSRYHLEPVERLTVDSWLPVKTMLGFYSTGLPLSHQEGPRRTVSLYRITNLSGQARSDPGLIQRSHSHPD